MKEQYIDKFLVFVMAILIVFGLFLQVSTMNNTKKLKNDEIKKSQQYASTIARLLQFRIKGGFEETLTKDSHLRDDLNQLLQTFLTKQYRYIFVLQKNREGHYRFLLDGAKDNPEEYQTIFFPKSQLFDAVFTSQKMQIIEQNEGVEEVWLSLVYPIVRNHQTEALLVLDLSKTYGEYLNDFNLPLMHVVWMMQAVLFFSLLLLISVAFRFYSLRKKLLVDTLTSTHTKEYLEEYFFKNNVDDYNAILIDIDEFSRINKTYGYADGNSVIQEFAKVIRDFLSKQSRVIRRGGTEFFIVVPKKEDGFEIAVQKLFDTLKEKKYLLKNEVVNLTVSMSAILIPKGSDSVYDIQRLLDEKLLEIKSRGKNGLRILGSETIKEIKYGNLDYIKEALDEERLLCLYQPIVHTQTQKTIKFEVLARLIDKEDSKKLISPLYFMPALKGTSQYIKMSKLVFREVFDILDKYPDVELSVNLDLDDLFNTSMMQLITKRLYSHRHIANRLTFEILEHRQIQNYEQVAVIFQQLKIYGSKIAIDDFGSGYANYIYLIKLDVDILKIDGSLIQELLHDTERTKIMLKSIKDLAETYGYEVVAEHISSKKIFEIIETLGIEYVQGYYLGVPKPLEVYLSAEKN